MSVKTDLKKTDPAYYSAPASPQVAVVEPGTYLVIEGAGEPGSEEFQSAVSALYSVAYTAKFQLKLENRDFVVGPLEGDWWNDRGWHWRLMIRVPDFVDSFLVKLIKQSVVEKKGVQRAADVTLEAIPEERCVQVLHVGPYATEQEDIQRMDELIAARRLVRSGPHHEVYLNDPRMVRPERVRTILRQPVR